MNRRNLRSGILALASLLGASGASSADQPGSPAVAAKGTSTTSFEKDVVPFLAKHCFSCHGGGKNKGELALDKYRDVKQLLKDRDVWETVAEMVRTGEMPPKDKAKDVPRPDPAEADRAMTAVDKILEEFDCGSTRQYGRVTIRRLNRAEYNNTIRDLVGVDFKPSADFPNDDVGYGFDNIGDVLSLSPLLLERYLTAAEAVLDRAIVIADPPTPKKERLGSPRASLGVGGPRATRWRPVPPRQGADLRADLPRRGRLHDPGRGVRPAGRRRAGPRDLAGRRPGPQGVRGDGDGGEAGHDRGQGPAQGGVEDDRGRLPQSLHKAAQAPGEEPTKARGRPADERRRQARPVDPEQAPARARRPEHHAGRPLQPAGPGPPRDPPPDLRPSKADLTPREAAREIVDAVRRSGLPPPESAPRRSSGS